jgi:hypothetical protein
MNRAAQCLRELSEPWERGDKIKRAIERAARAAGLSYWRAFDIWYGKARTLLPEESAAIESALERKRSEAERNELHQLKLRLARLEARMATTDADFFREDIAGLRSAFAPAGPRGSGRR